MHDYIHTHTVNPLLMLWHNDLPLLFLLIDETSADHFQQN